MCGGSALQVDVSDWLSSASVSALVDDGSGRIGGWQSSASPVVCPASRCVALQDDVGEESALQDVVCDEVSDSSGINNAPGVHVNVDGVVVIWLPTLSSVSTVGALVDDGCGRVGGWQSSAYPVVCPASGCVALHDDV